LRKNKRQDPDFENISGYLPIEISGAFKECCRDRKISQNDGLEYALNTFIKVKEFFLILEQGERPSIGLIAELSHDLAISADSLMALCNTVLLHRKNGDIEHETNGN